MIKSTDVQSIIAFFRDAQEEYDMMLTEQQLCEGQQQDILHDFELIDHSHNECGHLGKELSKVRRRRRTAKNQSELLQPLHEWINNNDKAINLLQRVLGDMRKIETNQKNRIYRRKADGKGEVIEPRERVDHGH